LTPDSSVPKSSSASASTRSLEGLAAHGLNVPHISKERQLPGSAPFLHQVVGPLNLEAQSAISSHPCTAGHVAISGEPDELLNTFRNNLARQAPFVVIPATMTAQDLREKPFLYSTIIMAASYNDVSHQLFLGNQILKYLAEHLLVRGEESLDLLQGLLVYITWFA